MLIRNYYYFCCGMKKVLALILAVFYMATSTGATLHVHYCMGKLVDVQLWKSDVKKTCSKCGTESSKKSCVRKCCRDTHKTVKLEKDQKTAERMVDAMQFTALVTPVDYVDLSPVYSTSLVEEYPVSNAPPRSSKIHLHILHCLFLI